MSQKQNKTYRKVIRKTIAENKAAVADEFVVWLKQQSIRYRLKLIWVILRGSRRRTNK